MLAPRDTLWSAHDEVIRDAFSLLKLTKDDVFADFGCGDGRVLQAAATTVGCKCVGYEINADRAASASASAALAGLSDLVTIHAKNALEANFGEPSAVFLFLIKRGLRIILPYLNEAARSRPGGIRVVTALYRFPEHVKPAEIHWVHVSDDLKVPLYRYHFPLPDAVVALSCADVDGGDVAGCSDGPVSTK
jgi:SAM-dependent methyltransferase